MSLLDLPAPQRDQETAATLLKSPLSPSSATHSLYLSAPSESDHSQSYTAANFYAKWVWMCAFVQMWPSDQSVTCRSYLWALSAETKLFNWSHSIIWSSFPFWFFNRSSFVLSFCPSSVVDPCVFDQHPHDLLPQLTLWCFYIYALSSCFTQSVTHSDANGERWTTRGSLLRDCLYSMALDILTLAQLKTCFFYLHFILNLPLWPLAL